MRFMLVHGAWHGGWCYKRVAAKLRAAGHEVYTPTLTGLGERSHLMNRSVNLETHVQDVVNVLRWEELDDVVLCGHSYGGIVITGAADRVPEQVRALVYLDAFVPADGQSLFDLAEPALVESLREDAGQNGESYLMTPIPAAVFNVNRADADWVDGMCVKHPLVCFEQKAALTGAIDRIAKRTYVLASDWPPPNMPGGFASPFLPIAERLEREGEWRMITMRCGHDVMLDKPSELAEILIAAA